MDEAVSSGRATENKTIVHQSWTTPPGLHRDPDPRTVKPWRSPVFGLQLLVCYDSVMPLICGGAEIDARKAPAMQPAQARYCWTRAFPTARPFRITHLCPSPDASVRECG